MAGCSDAPEQRDFLTQDSAGVTVVQSFAPAWEDPSKSWVVDPIPFLDLTVSGSGESHEFYRVADATRLSDGRIVVANAGSHEVRVYTAEGQFLTAAGREGEGPGEYRQIMGIEALPGDSLMVHSWPLQITLLDPQLDPVRSFELGGRSSAVHLLGPTTLLVQLNPRTATRFEGSTIVVREPVPLVRASITGEILDTIGTAPGVEEVMFPLDRGFSSVGLMFGKTTTLDAGDGVVVIGDADRMEFEIWDREGSLSMVVRVPAYSLELSDEEIAEERFEWFGADPSTVRRTMAANMPEPSTRPAFDALLRDQTGNIWAARYRGLAEADEPQVWEVFDASGRWLGPINIPSRFTVLEIGTDYILGVGRDPLGVEQVQLLRVIRGTSS